MRNRMLIYGRERRAGSPARLLVEDPARTQDLLRRRAARVREPNRQLAGGR